MPHRLKELVTGVSIGTLTSALLLDWLGGAESRPAARRLIGIGLLGAGVDNPLAAGLFAASYVARRRGGDGRLLALAGGAALAARHVKRPDEEGWTDVLAEAELQDESPRCVDADGTAVMVVKRRGALFALSDHCSHLGGPLHEGTFTDTTVTCPLHESVFALRDGALIHGPAAYPQPAWDARSRAGRIEVRRR